MKQPPSSCDRRQFLKTGGALAAGLLTHEAQAAQNQLPAMPSNPRTPASMPTRNLGKIGYKVGLFSLGAQAAVEKPNNFDAAVSIIERCLDLGVNLIDTAPRYGYPERWSEQYIGRVMEHRRSDAFLCTKTMERSREKALHDIEQSLKLMKTDHLDLWVIHNIGIPEEVNAVFAKGGAMEALTQMHDQKVVRYLGVTSHYQPDPMIDMINRFPFDACIIALNAADIHNPHSFTQRFLPLALEKRMGIIGMKIASRGRILSTWTPPPIEEQKHSWEGMSIQTDKPGTLNIRDATKYVLSLPVSTNIIGCDNIAQVEENVQIAREFTPLSQAQMTAIANQTEPIAKQALFFHYEKRSTDIDLPANSPEDNG
jgi:aryl-alcohol dehydrogenase-like predicted oxidoreductase